MAETFTQAERLIAVDTPLGTDKLLLRSFSGTEGISQPFNFQLDMLSEDSEINFDKIVGQKVSVSLKLADGSSKRYFHGHVSRFMQLPGEGRLARYQADMVPWLWFLTRTADCRIFQDKAVPDIVQEVFRDFGFTDFEKQLQKSYDRWEYCVQYRETACNFVMRLMEQEGIFFFFRHEKDKHVLVMADAPTAHKPCPGAASARYERIAGAGYGREEDVVLRWRYQQELRSGKYAIQDYNFETPGTDLLSNVDSRINQGGNRRFEIFDYPGEYEKRNQGDAQVKLRVEEQELPHEVIRGDGNCRAFSPGFRFGLTEHVRGDQNIQYVLTSVSHSAHSGSFYSDRAGEGSGYANSFACIPYSVPFRPPRMTAKHLVQGPQTAVVVGPQGEEIYVDKHGRVKVQFHWDRRGGHNEKSSCWIRVSQPWAGKNWGAIWIPRIGQEVIVDFLEGDPDRPIITGRVYNADQTPPYDLPANQTQSGFKSRSSKGGGGSNFNEIRFEDKKGSEEVYIHAEKNLTTMVEADESRSVGASRSTTVQKDDKLVVKDGNREAKLEKGDDNLLAQIGDITVQAPAGTIELQANNIKLSATMDLTLTCGPGSININTAGIITIQGTMVKIN